MLGLPKHFSVFFVVNVLRSCLIKGMMYQETACAGAQAILADRFLR